MMAGSENRRILVIDDNPSIQEDFRKVLVHGANDDASLEAKEALLFGHSQKANGMRDFEVNAAYQGEEGLEMIVRARQQGQPYAMAFVDVRMPPGIDGIETIGRIFPADPDVQIVICSAYSDYSAGEILDRLGVSDRMLMLRKPCDMAEILLIATTLCQKWNVAHASRLRRGSVQSPAFAE